MLDVLGVLMLINMVGSAMFVVDKIAAARGRRRLSESALHVVSLLGAVFSILPLMYLIRHKNRKASFYVVTYAIAGAWVILWLVIVVL